MRPREELMPLLENQAHHERRRYGRIRCSGVLTSFGEVLDLSANGVKVACRGWRRPHIGAVLDLELQCPGIQTVIKSQLVWFQRHGLRSYEAAFEFLDPTPETRQTICRIAQYALRNLAVEASRASYE